MSTPYAFGEPARQRTLEPRAPRARGSIDDRRRQVLRDQVLRQPDPGRRRHAPGGRRAGVSLPNSQVVGSDDLRIVRTRRDRDPLGVRIEHVDRRVVHDVVVRAAVNVLLDGDAERCQQRRELRVGSRHADELGIEAVQIRGDSLRRVAIGVDADEQHARRQSRRAARDVRARPARAGSASAGRRRGNS